MSIGKTLRSGVTTLKNSLRYTGAYGADALTKEAANAMVDHFGMSGLLPWTDLEEGIVVVDSGRHQLGFGFAFSPVLVGGSDIEKQMEAMISRAPDNTIIQFAAHSSAAIDDRLSIWRSRRMRYNQRPILQEMVARRADHIMSSAHGDSLLSQERYFPREVNYYVFVSMLFTGDPADDKAIEDFLRGMKEYRASMEGYLSAMGLAPSPLSDASIVRLLRRLCNPQMTPSRLDQTQPPIEPGPGKLVSAVVEKQTRLRLQEAGGALQFSDDERSAWAIPITMDDYPDAMRLWMTGELTGAVTGADRIPNVYWLTTIIHKPPQESIKDDTQARMGLISKQCMSDSEWYKNMMPHLFRRRNDTALLLEMTRKNFAMVRMMTACLIFTDETRVNTDADYVTALWRKAGFRASPEKYISLPVWQTILPWGYNPDLDLPNRGLQRSFRVHSLNAATASICQGDWSGNGPILKTDAQGNKYAYANGLLLMSRRGQLSCIDLFTSDTNYNFAVVATSGAGKSFLANEMIVDMLCRNGIVRVIDAGGSYQKLNRSLEGNELRFDPNRPFSINPFWGLSTQGEGEGGEFAEMAPVLKGLVCQMAFPVQEPTNYQYSLAEQAVAVGFERAGGEMSTSHIYDVLDELGKAGDTVAAEMAVQMRQWAYGRYAAWFNGPPQVDLTNDFTILELEELNNDKDLRAVVLTMVMALTTRDMYLKDRSLPKMLLIDEAWDLLGGVHSGQFIETAFRRIRKYFGTAGIITQGFADLEKSAAAQAAFDSCAWKFVLKQSGPSLDHCIKESKMGRKDDFFRELLASVRPGMGYSEVYIQNDAGGGLFRFVVDPYSYYLYTTKASDLALIEQAKRRVGGDLQKAIGLLADGSISEDEVERGRAAGG